MMEEFLGGRVVLHAGDCREVLKGIADASVDSVVTDPPYALVSIAKRFGADGAAPATGGPYKRTGAGFMGKRWDNGEASFAAEFWAEVLRVLKPGGHVLAFGGTRTYHRLACAIEDAGFEIRDQIGWAYGSGFPKSHNVGKAIDRAGGHSWERFATLLDRLIKDAGFNYTSLDRALGIPSAGSNSCYWVRADERGGLPPRQYYDRLKELLSPPRSFTDLYDLAEREVLAIERRKNAPSGIVGAGRDSVEIDREITAPATAAAREWEGWGTALKPAWEPIVMARKALIGTVAENVLAHGTGAINIDGCWVGVDADELVEDDGGRVNTSAHEGYHRPNASMFYINKAAKREGPSNAVGRWPANLIHDGSEEVLAAFPTSDGGGDIHKRSSPKPNGVYGEFSGADDRWAGYADLGSAARFFYTAKADAEDRIGSKHPTVKPLDLMQYLVRLVTPPGGTVLDPFAGTGTTGEAAFREGFKAILIEREPEYQADIARRMELATSPTKRAAVAKTKNKLQGAEGTPLFGDA